MNRKVIQADAFVENAPFLLAKLDNFLAEDIFVSAKDYFQHKMSSGASWNKEEDTVQKVGKSSRNYFTYGGGREGDSSEKIKGFFEGSMAWAEIFRIFDSQQLAYEIRNASPTGSMPLRPIKIRSASYKAGFLSSLLFTNCYVNYKLSRYPPGSGISLHRDHSEKMMAFLLYFGFSDGVIREEGGTQFYNDTLGHHVEDLAVDHYASNVLDYELVIDVEPTPNRLAFFGRSSNSWHGVKSLTSKSDENITRNNLQINYMHCKKTAGVKSLLKLHRILRVGFNFFADYILALYLVLLESYFYTDPKLKKPFQGKKTSSVLGQAAQAYLPTKLFQISQNLYLFFKERNFFLDRRRRLIRRTVHRYSAKPRKGITKAANYMYDLMSEKSLKALCFGIYDDFRFELFLANEYGINVFAADPTPIALTTYDKLSEKGKIIFEPCAISTKAGKQKFYFDSDDANIETFEGSLQNISGTEKFLEVDCRTLDEFKNVCGRKAHENYILKMDIEGGAVEVLEHLVSNSVNRSDLPAQIMVELELPKSNYDKENHRIAGILGSLYATYDIFYISGGRRYTKYEFLMVRKQK